MLGISPLHHGHVRARAASCIAACGSAGFPVIPGKDHNSSQSYYAPTLYHIVAQTEDRFINRKPRDLGLFFFSDFRVGLDPVFRGFPQIHMHSFTIWHHDTPYPIWQFGDSARHLMLFQVYPDSRIANTIRYETARFPFPQVK